MSWSMCNYNYNMHTCTQLHERECQGNLMIKEPSFKFTETFRESCSIQSLRNKDAHWVSMESVNIYVIKGVSIGWPYFVYSTLVKVSMESVDTLCQGVSMGWLYYVCPTLVKVSMESTDTLLRVYPWVGHTMYVQHWSKYPWNPQILCQGCIHGLATLCMSNIGESIYGICGYFIKRVSMGWLYYVCTM